MASIERGNTNATPIHDIGGHTVERQEFAVYKGDKLLAIGTMEEVCSKLGYHKDYISWLASPSAIRRMEESRPKNRKIAVRL